MDIQTQVDMVSINLTELYTREGINSSIKFLVLLVN